MEIKTKTGWGATGTRYDEICDSCGEMSEIDNNNDLCRSCYGPGNPVKKNRETAKCREPYRRGIGQGFGSAEDGDEWKK